MRKSFPLFQTPLDLAHSYWRRILKKGDTVIDATCGNGKDLLILAELAIDDHGGCAVGYDIQEEAIEKSWMLLRSHLNPAHFAKVDLKQMSHVHFPFPKESVKIVVYNLGYLPGGTKALTTKTATTLESLKSALPLIIKGGAISITCYPGHEEGLNEEKTLKEWAISLDPKEWSVCYHQWLNRTLSPSLLFIQRFEDSPEGDKDRALQ